MTGKHPISESKAVIQNQTTPLENFTQSLSLWNTGLTPSAAFGSGVIGTGVETVGWLGNTTTTQSSSTGK